MRPFQFESFELVPAQRLVRVAGEPVTLGSRAYDVLLALVERAGRIVTKDELLASAWPGMVVEEANVQVQVSALRKVLGPDSIATVSGRGYRLTAALLQESATDAPSTPRAAPARRHNLPQPRTSFIGREQALERGRDLLAANRLLTLTGLGGCGKTRLALQLAQQVMADFDDGVWFVDLASVRDAPGVGSAVARALDVNEDADTPLVERLLAALADRRLLLVLDNCEHLLAAAALLVDALLAGAAGVRILATSRQSLRVPGEQLFPVPPMSLPALPGAIDSEAVRLFLNRAELAWPAFAPRKTDLADIATICHRLDGIPLAIELGAARVGMLSVREIGARLDDRFRFLTDASAAKSRHQTLKSTLEWSYECLTAPDQGVLRSLAVFAGGCTLSAAARVCALDDDMAALERLTSLYEKSLLVVEREGQETRYTMLETVRAYAQERLVEAGEELPAFRRHLRHVVTLATEAMAGLQGPRQGEWMERLRLEQENIVVAHLRCADDPQAGDAALELVATLSRYWLNSAQLERGYSFARAALARATAGSDALLHCRALAAAGNIAFRMGRYEESLALADHCLDLASTLDKPSEIAAALALKSKCLHATGQDRLALEYALRTCTAARSLGVTTRLSAALNNLAEIHRGLGQFDAARASYEEAIAITRQLGYPGGTFTSLCNLARLLITTGELACANTLILEGVTLWRAAGLKGMGKDLLECCAGLAARAGDLRATARFSGAALARLDEAAIRREQVDEAFLAPLLAGARQAAGAAVFDAQEAAGRASAYVASMTEAEDWLASSLGGGKPAD